MKSAFRRTILSSLAVAAGMAAGGSAVDAASHWSADSKVVALSGRPKSIEAYSISGSLLWRKTFDRPVKGFAVSPDGARIAYGLEDEGLWIVNLPTGQAFLAHKLEAGELGQALQWSPDGSVVVFSVMAVDLKTQIINFDQRPKTFLVKADGSGEVELKP